MFNLIEGRGSQLSSSSSLLYVIRTLCTYFNVLFSYTWYTTVIPGTPYQVHIISYMFAGPQNTAQSGRGAWEKIERRSATSPWSQLEIGRKHPFSVDNPTSEILRTNILLHILLLAIFASRVMYCTSFAQHVHASLSGLYRITDLLSRIKYGNRGKCYDM